MGSFFDLDASLDAAGRPPAEQPVPEESIFTDIGDFLSTLGGLGLGALDTTFDVLDRFNSAKNNAIGLIAGVPSASVAQIFEQFDPFNLITETEATPFTGEQLFGELGIGDVEIGGGVGTRDVGGIAFDILTDPLNVVGGLIGKGVMKGAGAAGRTFTEFLEGVGGISGGSGDLSKFVPRGAEDIAKLEEAELLRVADKFGTRPELLRGGDVNLVPRNSLAKMFDIPKTKMEDEVLEPFRTGFDRPVELTVDRNTGRIRLDSGEDIIQAAQKDNLSFKDVPVRITEGDVRAPRAAQGTKLNPFTETPGENQVGLNTEITYDRVVQGAKRIEGEELQALIDAGEVPPGVTKIEEGGERVYFLKNRRTGTPVEVFRTPVDDEELPRFVFRQEPTFRGNVDEINKTGRTVPDAQGRTKLGTEGRVAASVKRGETRTVFQIDKKALDEMDILREADFTTIAELEKMKPGKLIPALVKLFPDKLGGLTGEKLREETMGRLLSIMSENNRVRDIAKVEQRIAKHNDRIREVRKLVDDGVPLEDAAREVGQPLNREGDLPPFLPDTILPNRVNDVDTQIRFLGKPAGGVLIPKALMNLAPLKGETPGLFELAEAMGFQGASPRGIVTTLLNKAKVPIIKYADAPSTPAVPGQGVAARKMPKRVALTPKNIGIGQSKKTQKNLFDAIEEVSPRVEVPDPTLPFRAGEAVADLPLGVGKVSGVAARGAVSGATLLSKQFALRNLPGARAFEQLVFGANGRKRAALDKLEKTSRQIAKTLKDQADNRKLIDFIEENPASLELFAHEVLGEAPETLNVGGGKRTLADFLADPKQANNIRNLKAQIKKMPKHLRDATELYFKGTEDFFRVMPGKQGREIELFNRSILHRDLVDDFIKRHDLRHLTHVRTGRAGNAEELAKDLLADFESMVNTRGASTSEVYRNPEGFMRRGLKDISNKTKARKISKALKDLDKEFPGMFEQSLAKINFVEGQRYASAIAASDILKGVASNEQWVRSGRLTDEAIKGGWVQVPLDQIPANVRKDFIEVTTRKQVRPRKGVKTASGKPKFETIVKETETPMLMRQEIAEALFDKHGVINQMLRPNMIKDHVKVWRGITRYWKGWTLGPFPSWWSRNFVGNIWLNHLAGVSSPRLYAEAGPIQIKLAKVMAGKDISTFAKETIKVADETGKLVDIPLLDFMTEMVDNGILGGGFYTSDFGAEFLQAFTSANPMKTLFKLDPQQNIAARWGFNVNAAIEDNARIAHFIAKRRKGLPAEEAAFSVKTHLFDYDNLTPFEQEVLRDFVPFYSWFRQNIPAQVRAVAETPHKVAQIGKMQITFDEKNRANVPDEILPEWVQSSTPLVTGNIDGKLHIFMLKNWLPLADLAEIDTPQKMMNFALNASHPIIREALSQTFNWDPYFQRMIERYPGERETLFGYPIGKRYSHALRNIRGLKYIDDHIGPLLGFKTGSKWTQELIEELSPAENLARSGFGLKLQKIDLKRNKQILTRKTRGEIRQAQGRLRIARKKNDAANANVLRLQISQLREKLRVLNVFDPTRHPALQGLATDGISGD